MMWKKVVRQPFGGCKPLLSRFVRRYLLRSFIFIIVLGSIFIFIIHAALKSDNHNKFFPYDTVKGAHKLAIIVPFRNALSELLKFAPHMQLFLKVQGIEFQIYVIHQIDDYRFNRASLINIGFQQSKKDGFDYLAMHDVDLLPLNQNLSYAYPADGAFHLAAPHLHPIYHYKKFLGGILLITHYHFEKANGMSNRYWGWGLEDDEFRVRLWKNDIKIFQPKNITTGKKDTFLHVHDKKTRKRDQANVENQRKKTNKLDRMTGMNNVQYKIESIVNVKIDDTPVKFVNVFLKCDLELTPWCKKH